MISQTQRPLHDNTQQSQETDIHAPGAIRTRNPSNRAAADPRLRLRGHWNRQSIIIVLRNIDWLCTSYNLMIFGKEFSWLHTWDSLKFNVGVINWMGDKGHYVNRTSWLMRLGYSFPEGYYVSHVGWMGETTNSYRLLVWNFKHTERKVEDNIKKLKVGICLCFSSAGKVAYMWGV
jgi:hypothetical protein